MVPVPLRDKIFLPVTNQAPHLTLEAAVKLTSFREQPLLSPSKNNAAKVNFALVETTRYSIKIKYSGIAAMQLQIISVVEPVLCPKLDTASFLVVRQRHR